MRRVYIPAVASGVLCLVLLVYIGATGSQLPERVAAHFNAIGQPDGWMTRPGYMLLNSIMSLVLPLSVVAVMFLTRFLPAWMVNLPDKDYCLSPEQRSSTNAYLLGHSMWLGCLIVCLLGGATFLTIQANHTEPVQVPGVHSWVMMAGFLTGMTGWAISLYLHFKKGPQD